MEGNAMADIDLDAMSLADLNKLQKNVTNAIDGFKDRERRAALNAVEAIAKEMGFKLSELVDGSTKKAKGVSVPKYRHPENPSLTWTGRGRQPDWLKQALAAGGSRDDFLIKN